MNWELGLLITCVFMCYTLYAELIKTRKELQARLDRIEAKTSDTFDAASDLYFHIKDASREVVDALKDSGR